jgi:LacI family transcriptional regulator
MTVTIRDVALAAGVHISTVSRALSAAHKVRPDTRDRVMAAVEALGYRPNPQARSLITGRTHSIGLIVADIANPFFPPLIKAAEGLARQRDYRVFVADTDEDPAIEAELIQALAKQVDGVLLCSPRMTDQQVEQFREQVPMVLVNRQIDGIPAVLMDVGHGSRLAVEHLVGLGHRRLALLAGPRGSWTNKEIRRAVTAAARDHGAQLTVLGPNPPTEQAGRDAADQVLDAGASAVLAYNDLMAIGLMQSLVSRGVAVPAELSVVGIDNIAASRLTTPQLTTVANPTAAAGRAAADMLLQYHGTTRSENGDENGTGAASLTLHTTLVVRESTGPAPAHAP